MKRVIASSILIFLLISIGTVAAILYAKGYRIIPEGGRPRLAGTGILVVTSKPDGARVYINEHLTTATNNTINLAPGEYDVRIEKDGYFVWRKKMIVKNELVAEANATLFPLAPKLEALTIIGAAGPVLDPTGTLLSYTVASSSASKNGIYTLDISSRQMISLGGIVSQLADNSTALFSASLLSFSPDGTQLLATISGELGPTSYLLNSKGFTGTPADVTATLSTLQKDWERQQTLRAKRTIDSLPREIRALASENFRDISFSAEADKLLYTASQSAALPVIKKPRLAAVNPTPEDRNIKEGNVYVYDIKEDKNYLIYGAKQNESAPLFRFLSDSLHLVFVQDKRVQIEEFDGTNKTVVYAGPFVDNYVFPWGDASSLVILTNLNIPDAPNNLYRISLR